MQPHIMPAIGISTCVMKQGAMAAIGALGAVPPVNHKQRCRIMSTHGGPAPVHCLTMFLMKGFQFLRMLTS